MAFVKFTLADIREAVRDKLDDDGFPDDSIDRAANDFQFELFNDNHIRFMEEHDTLTPGSGDFTVPLPDDFLSLINLTVFDSSTVYRDITESGWHDYKYFMKNFGNFSYAAAGKIYDFTFFGEALRFARATDALYNLSLDYLRTPVLMEEDADECELPINCRELMTIGTLNRIQRLNEDYNEAGQENGYLVQLRRSFVKNYGRGSEKVGPRVIRTNRGKGSWNAARDF